MTSNTDTPLKSSGSKPALANRRSSRLDSSSSEITRKVFVGNLAVIVTRNHLVKRFFRKFGEVERAQIVFDRKTGQSKKIAFVTFVSKESVEKVLQASEQSLLFYHRVLRVHPAEHRKSDRMMSDVLPDKSGDGNHSISEDSFEGDAQSSLLFSLNLDCFSEIFLYLSIRERLRLELVCKKMKSVTVECWKRVRRVSFGNILQRAFSGVTDEQVCKILKRASTSLIHVDLSSCRGITDALPKVLCHAAPNLESLDLSSTNAVFTPMVAEIIGKNAPKLKSFCLRDCLSLSDEGLGLLLKYAKSLEELDITRARCSLKSLKTCTNLKRLTLAHCLAIVEDDIFDQVLQRNCMTLEYLDITGCHVKHLILSQDFLKLHTLIAADVHTNRAPFEVADDTEIEMDLSGAVNLKTLNLSHSPLLVRENNMKKLEGFGIRQLDVSRSIDMDNYEAYSGSVLHSIGCLHELRTLNVNYNDMQPQQISELAKLGKIEQFQMIGVMRTMQLKHLVEFLESWPHLTHLDLSGFLHLPHGAATLPGDATPQEFIEAIKTNVGNGNKTLTITTGGSSLQPSLYEIRDTVGLDISVDNNCVEWLRPYYHDELDDDFLHEHDDWLGPTDESDLEDEFDAWGMDEFDGLEIDDDDIY